MGDLLTRQRDCLVNLLRLLTYASNEEALDDTNSTLYIKLRPLSRDVTSLSEYANSCPATSTSCWTPFWASSTLSRTKS